MHNTINDQGGTEKLGRVPAIPTTKSPNIAKNDDEVYKRI